MDLLLRGGFVVDGSRTEGRQADLRVSSGRIVEIGPNLDATGADTVDLDGLCLAPGFIDIHTHLDGQVFWDPQLSPSSWHGVTTAVMSNCGFGIAPVRPEHHATMIETIEEVEGIPRAALEKGVPWGSFRTFADYLDLVERTPTQINVGAFITHTAVRLEIMGDAAWERHATEDEIAAMQAVVSEALEVGALGFSTSTAGAHVAADGRPVPSRIAAPEEIFALAAMCGEAGKGVLEMTIGTGWFVEQFADLSRRTGRPVTWSGFHTEQDFESLVNESVMRLLDLQPRGRMLTLLDYAAGLGGQVLPQTLTRPITFRIHMEDPFLFASTPGFDVVMADTGPEGRAAWYRDATWRDRVRPEATKAVGTWAKVFRIAFREENGHHYERVSGDSLAAEAERLGTHPFDLMLDTALSEGLDTPFQIAAGNRNVPELEEMLRDPRVVLGLSDAGAHVDQLCESSWPSHLLGHWVRDRELLSLETAIWRMSGQPSQLFGFADRGFIREGNVADLVAFDLERVTPGDLERVNDLPDNVSRLVARGEGIEHVWVGGTAIRRDGEVLVDSNPGTVVRS